MVRAKILFIKDIGKHRSTSYIIVTWYINDPHNTCSMYDAGCLLDASNIYRNEIASARENEARVIRILGLKHYSGINTVPTVLREWESGKGETMPWHALNRYPQKA